VDSRRLRRRRERSWNSVRRRRLLRETRPKVCTRMAAADVAATAADVGAATATGTPRERACRRHGPAERESHCKNDHHLTQHEKPPLRMFSASTLIDKPTPTNKTPRPGEGWRDSRKSEQFVTT